MGHTQTAVGCAVGIPIGVGIVIAAIFWLRLQRRFKKEMEDDKELEHAIYDESGFINFDNFDSLKQEHPGTNVTDLELHPTTSNTNDPTPPQRKGHGNAYVPAYRKKINSMQVRATRMSSFNNPSDSNNSLFNGRNPNNSSVTSMSESLQLQQQKHHQMMQQQQQSYKQSTMSSMYNQMVPMVETLNNESYFTKPAAIGGSSSSTPGTPLPAGSDANTTHHSTSFLMGNDSSQISGDKEGVQLSTLYHNSDLDLGSYYPRRPTNPTVTDASSDFHSTANSSGPFATPKTGNRVFSGRSGATTYDSPANAISNSSGGRQLQNQTHNIFATPSTERSGFDFPSSSEQNSIEQPRRTAHHLHNRSRSQNNVEVSHVVSTATGTDPYDQNSSDSDSHRDSSVYKLQNNYDVKNNNEITEEDQYENEYTNYTENRRQFIDSLRPT